MKRMGLIHMALFPLLWGTLMAGVALLGAHSALQGTEAWLSQVWVSVD